MLGLNLPVPVLRQFRKRDFRSSIFKNLYGPRPSGRVSYTNMSEFFSGLKDAFGRRMLWEVVLGVRRNDLLGLAGQLAYFFLLFFFPFLIFLVSLTGLVIGNPEAGLKNLFEVSPGSCPRTPARWCSTTSIAPCARRAPARSFLA